MTCCVIGDRPLSEAMMTWFFDAYMSWWFRMSFYRIRRYVSKWLTKSHERVQFCYYLTFKWTRQMSKYRDPQKPTASIIGVRVTRRMLQFANSTQTPSLIWFVLSFWNIFNKDYGSKIQHTVDTAFCHMCRIVKMYCRSTRKSYLHA